MRERFILLLLLSGALHLGPLGASTQLTGVGVTQQSCPDTSNSTSAFLTCVGFPSGPGAGDQHILKLKALMEALLDVHSFIRSDLSGIPLLDVFAGVNVNSEALLKNDDIVTAWLQIRLTPLLSTISQNFLTCLGNSDFSCQTYQTMVQQMSQHISSLDPVRQKWVYSSFIQPFLSRNTSAGCVLPDDTTEDWLLKNFGSFLVWASIKDFSNINGFFTGLDVLHLLSPEQKAQLVLYPEMAGLDNSSMGTVLESLLASVLPSGGSAMNMTNGSMWNPGFPSLDLSSSQDPVREVMNGLMTEFRPVWSFVKDFVSFTHQNLSGMRSATLVQAVLNMTLAELAAPYKQNSSAGALTDRTPFDPTDVNAWFSHVVTPILSRYVSSDIPQDLTAVFHNVFYMETTVNKTQDNCSVTLEDSCSVTHLVEQVVKVVQCASSTNLQLTEETLISLTLHLTESLNTLLNQLTHTNFSSPDSPFANLLDRIHGPLEGDLQNELFITMWFHLKLKPMLPYLTPEYLTCLSAKPFSCRTYQIIVAALSSNMSLMPVARREMVYKDFIRSFLLQHSTTGGCMSNSSSEWIMMNLAGFSEVVTVMELYLLNPALNPLEALDVLTLNQKAELMVQDLPMLPERKRVIEVVLTHMLTSPKMMQQLPQLITLTLQEWNPNTCSSSREISAWLHLALLSANPEQEAVIWSTINVLTLSTPADCVNISGECINTPQNGLAVCENGSSSALQDLLNSPHDGHQLCNFSVTQLACAQLVNLTAADLAAVLSCKIHGNDTASDQTWKIFLTRVKPLIGSALDLLSNKVAITPPPPRPLVVMLDMIAEVMFSSSDLSNNSFVQLWVGNRLRPFLPYASQRFLSCFTMKNLNCDTFQIVVNVMNDQFNVMTTEAQMAFYVYFINTFLSLNQTGGCAAGLNISNWLDRNFGQFLVFATISELQRLNPTFSVTEVLNRLTVAQLAQVSSSGLLLTSPDQVILLLQNIPDAQIGPFFSKLSTSLTFGGVVLAPPVRLAFLNQLFARVNLADPTIPDSEVQQWLGVRLTPFISSIQTSQVPQFFSMITQRECNITQQGVALLNSARSAFNPTTTQEIYSQILISLQGPVSLRCYSGQSYYAFLQSFFLSFQFPNLSTFLSLIPPERESEVMNSMSPPEISDLLSRPGVVDDGTKLCQIFRIYNRTKEYLQKELVLPSPLAQQMLACVWPLALGASSQVEVDQWFDVSLVQYLPFLSAQQINSSQVNGASCLSFRKYVSLMGRQHFSTTDFRKQDVYQTIQSYLTTGSTPKCYNSSDPVLGSTAWFAQYIGVFITSITVDDLQNFGGVKLQPFTVDEQNLELFSEFNVSADVVGFYTELLYEQDSNFSATLLPLQFLCDVPASAFASLNVSETIKLTQFLQQLCTNVDPTVFASLAENVDSLSEDEIKALGNASVGISVGQILGSSPSALFASLSTLSEVDGWSLSQSLAIVQSMLSGGVFQIVSVDSLVQLGNLLSGVPSSFFSSVSPADLLKAMQQEAFVSDIIATPTTSQQSVVNQIISVSSTPDSVLQNVPDAMATLIPRPSLLFLSQQSATVLNRKQWTNQQAVLFFDLVASQIPDADSISFQVLQGFTCTRVQSYSVETVNKLIRGCRSRGKKKVTLEESQLTCMYSYVKKNTVTDFTQYPADMLLYYDVSKLDPSLCQSFYSALGEADLNLFSSTLSFKKDALITGALQCLGVSGKVLTQAQVSVLGQMLCVMDSSYILNSDPSVLEKLKLCGSLSQQQSSAVENMLLKGTTGYGTPTSWNQTTLTNLLPLPLYLSTAFWQHFTQKEQKDFLRTFIPEQKKSGTSRSRISSMLTEVGKNYKNKNLRIGRFRRDTACTAGVITQIQVSDASFPLGYDANQFNICLSANTLKNNLGAISDKATASEFQRIILEKLNQAYPSGISDEVLQVLGPASRSASTSDISKWNITRIDTLSALMRSYDGDWTPEQVKAIVSQYLIGGTRTLGTSELNSLGGKNLCALDVILLRSISSSSLQRANTLSMSSCSLEQKQVLFEIAQNAFNDRTISKIALRDNIVPANVISANSYQLIQSYLGGANLTYIRTLSISNISMDLLTFITLNQKVINNLTVSEVRGLLGANLADLKTYENNTVVQDWITRQLQSDLNSLGIGLTGGRVDTATATTTTTTTTAVGLGSRVSTLPWLQQLLLLLVTMATLWLLH